MPLPVGASHSSQARPSTISASSAASATARAARRRSGVRGGRRRSVRRVIAGMMPAMNRCRSARSARSAPARACPSCSRRCSTWPWLDTLRTLRQRFREDRLGLTAGSLTFTTLIALVPLVTVMLAVFTAFPMFSSFQDALQTVLPADAWCPTTSRSPVLRRADRSSPARRSGSAPSGWCCWWSRALALMLTIDRTLNAHLARAQAAADRAARAGLLGGADARARCCSGVSLSLTSYAISASQRPGRRAARRRRRCCSTCVEFVLLARRRWPACSTTCPTPRCAGAMRWPAALFVARRASRSPRRLLAWYVVQVPTYSAVYGAFATRADPAALDLPRLGHRAARRGDRGLCAEPADARAARWPTRRAARFQLALAVLRELTRRARGGRARPERRPAGGRAAHRPAADSSRSSRRWSSSTGSAGSTKPATRATCCCATRRATRLEPLVDAALLLHAARRVDRRRVLGSAAGFGLTQRLTLARGAERRR